MSTSLSSLQPPLKSFGNFRSHPLTRECISAFLQFSFWSVSLSSPWKTRKSSSISFQFTLSCKWPHSFLLRIRTSQLQDLSQGIRNIPINVEHIYYLQTTYNYVLAVNLVKYILYQRVAKTLVYDTKNPMKAWPAPHRNEAYRGMVKRDVSYTAAIVALVITPPVTG